MSLLVAFATMWGVQCRPWAKMCCLDGMLHPGPGPSDDSYSYTDSLGGQLNATHMLFPLSATSPEPHIPTFSCPPKSPLRGLTGA